MFKKRIEFRYGFEKQINISDAGKDGSLFYEGYQQALAAVIDIVRSSEQYTGKCDDGRVSQHSAYYPKNDKHFYNFPNNIIVFTGERGAGKSSAMLTFADSLHNRGSHLYSSVFLRNVADCEMESENGIDLYNLLTNTYFLPLSPIDPTVLEDSEQVLITILAKLYQITKDRWEIMQGDLFGRSTQWERNDNARNELLELFSTCYNHIRQIKVEKLNSADYDGLEFLENLGDTVCLKKEIATLIEKVLDFCSEKKPYSFVVLQIDDTDMNMKKAYAILEDIRKFLFIPRVIVLMAADLEHLTDLVEKQFAHFHSLGDNLRVQRIANSVGLHLTDMNSFSSDQSARRLATQYIAKLFPQTRQISLPQLSRFLAEHWDIVDISYMVNNFDIFAEDIDFDTQEKILRLIYNKTGIVFLPTRSELHYIIPDNMRILSNFLSVLSQMTDIPGLNDPGWGFFPLDDEIYNEKGKDRFQELLQTIDAHEESLSLRQQNLQRFHDFFIHTWVQYCLDSAHMRFFQELERTRIPRKVKLICSQLDKEISLSQFLTKSERETNYQFGSEKGYAALVARITYLEKNVHHEEFRRFLFALECYISLTGHELTVSILRQRYDQIKSHSDHGADPDLTAETMMPLLFEKDILATRGCDFSRLYQIFGSHIFSYQYILMQNRKAVVRDSKIYNFPMHSFQTLDEFSSTKLQWPIEISKLKQFISKNQKKLRSIYIGAVEWMFSLLCDFDEVKSNKYIADLGNYFANVLYLSGENHSISPTAQQEFDEVFQTIPMIPWNQLQSTSLLVVLNWDIQRLIEERIQNGLIIQKSAPAIDWNTQVNGMVLFYDYLQRAFDDNAYREFSSEKITDKGYNYLGTLLNFSSNGIDFSQWLDVVGRMHIHSEMNISDNTERGSLVDNLNALLFGFSISTKNQKNNHKDNHPSDPK